MKKLAIITTHPIQYNAPWYKLLAERKIIDIKVFYTWSQVASGPKYDPGFGKNIEWDIPLLEGYEYEFVENTSKKPGTRRHKGIVNPSLIRRVESYGPDAVLVSGWNFHSHLAALRYFHGKIPVFFRGDSTLMDERRGFKMLLRRIALKRIYKNINYGLFVGVENKKYFLAHGLKEDQLVFVPHAIDNDRFTSRPETRSRAAEFKRQTNIPPEAILFMYVGKFELKKDPLLLARAFVKANLPDTRLLFVGDGLLKDELVACCKEHPALHCTEFVNQEELPTLYDCCEVLVVPSRGPGETWGLVVNEAMAMQKAIIVSDKCGCASDLVKDGVNGYTFKAGDAEDLAIKINIVNADKSRLEMMGVKSKELIKPYSFEVMVHAIEKLLLTRSPKDTEQEAY